MDKKISPSLAMTLIFILAGFLGAAVWFSDKENSSQNVSSPDDFSRPGPEKNWMGEERFFEEEEIVGGDQDEYGCIGSAGYTWCEEKKKCLRSWEESCADNRNP